MRGHPGVKDTAFLMVVVVVVRLKEDGEEMEAIYDCAMAASVGEGGV